MFVSNLHNYVVFCGGVAHYRLTPLICNIRSLLRIFQRNDSEIYSIQELWKIGFWFRYSFFELRAIFKYLEVYEPHIRETFSSERQMLGEFYDICMKQWNIDKAATEHMNAEERPQ